MIERIKEKIMGIIGTASGATSILGSWQICHNICLGLIAVLAVMGITVTGMPLAFLTEIAIPIWSVAVILLVVTGLLYLKRHCISRNLILFNLGLIITGVPFQFLDVYRPVLWVVGGGFVVSGIGLYIKGRMKRKKKRCSRCKTNNKLVVPLTVLAIIGLIVFINLMGNILAPTGSDSIPDNTETSFRTISTGTTEPGDVQIELTPQFRDGVLEFNIVANTHSVDLSQFDIMKIATLYINGQEIKPISASRLSGHHARGSMSFDVGTDSDTFTVVIEGIPMVQERTFRW